MFDLFGDPVGKRTEHVEWGCRSVRYSELSGPPGTVSPAPSEEAARGYDGAYYEGGPKMFEPVCRTVVTITSDWHTTEGVP